MHAITQSAIKAMKAARITAREAEDSVENARTAQQIPRVSRPMLMQPIFDWNTPGKYHELNIFENEIGNIS